jgi:hypothetical protein
VRLAFGEVCCSAAQNEGTSLLSSLTKNLKEGCGLASLAFSCCDDGTATASLPEGLYSHEIAAFRSLRGSDRAGRAVKGLLALGRQCHL